MKTNEVLETIKTRRSVRAYTAQAPETDDLGLYLKLPSMLLTVCIWKVGILQLSKTLKSWKN